METATLPRRGDTILRLPEVERRTGLRRTAIYNWIARGDFPKPLRLGPKASGWLESEIDQHIARLAAERDQGDAP
ncbi:MAG: AlpA family transcriptional regulator [Luteimonas sp.]|nr:AlpA family transcriptional regulator [Luteimonas sp.]